MNKSFWKLFFRTIRSSLSRFLAILAIVALGVGFLAGLLAAPVDMRISADTYYDDTSLFDIRIASTLGLTEEDITAVKTLPEVEGVMPVTDTDLVVISQEGDSYTTRLHSLPADTGEDNQDYLNRLILQDGRLPEKPGECVLLEGNSFAGFAVQPGTSLKLAPENEEINDRMSGDLTIVGTVRSAAYISREQENTNVGTGSLQMILFTCPETFDQDFFTSLYVTVQGAREENSFADGYDAKVDPVTDALEPLGEIQSESRYQQLVTDAQEKVQEGKDEYNEKKEEADKEFADAKAKLEEGAKEIADNELKLADALTAIANGQAELDAGREKYNTEIPSAQQQIADGYTQLATYQAQLDTGLAQIYTAQAQITAGYTQLDQGTAELAAAKAQLDTQEQNISALEGGKATLFALCDQYGLPYGDTSDATALTTIASLEQLLGGTLPLPIDPDQVAVILAQLAQLKAGLGEMAAAGTTTEGARAALDAGRVQYTENAAAAATARAELDASQLALNTQAAPLYTQQETLKASKTQLDNQNATLQTTIDNSLYQFSQAETELANARAQYDDGKLKLEEAKTTLAEGQAEYDTKKKEADEKLADAWEEILDGESKIREIETGEWLVMDRSKANAGFRSYDDNATKIGNIATVFPVFFFLVAALVALTTMTRMVEEERQQVGTMKALGYSRKKIAVKYLLYCALATVLGCVVGLVVGMQLFPQIIINAYNIMYTMPQAITPFNVPYALFASGCALGCTLLATLNACGAELREGPATLMLPKAPKAGKRILLEYITPLWNRMKFTQKVTARNLLRYKKRFFMTVIGIAGCTALLVTGFGVRDSVGDIASLQFDQLSQYQLIVSLKDKSALEGRDLQKILEAGDRITQSLPAMQDNGKLFPTEDAPGDNLILFVPEDIETMTEYFVFRQRQNHAPLSFGEEDAILSEKMAERHHISVGDTVTLETSDGLKGEVTVTGICENYVSHYLYLSPAGYEKAFGVPAENNTLLGKLPQEFTKEDQEALGTDLLKCRDIAGSSFTADISKTFGDSLASLDVIIVVLILSAGALAFVVLYNLTNINITERCKEIATIKVLGFYDKEVSAYIYRETALLTVIGTGVGLLLGMVLHNFVIRTAEVDMAMFGRTVFWMSYCWSALLTILFSLLVNLVMHRKLKKIDMVESMKAPE